MFKFLHAADIHLDSPLQGLERYDGAPVDEIRGATRRALENLVELALGQPVDFVLISGDLYDGDWKDANTGLFFVAQMRRLREANIPVIMIAGNHDAANKMTRSLPLPENVELLSARRAQTAQSPRLRELGVAVHGRSFAQAAETDNLVREYPVRSTGLFNIGLLHTALQGADGHARYAPCSLDDLRQKQYDYWALGHVHQRQVVCDDPPVVFSGNIQGRHIREPDAKGCYLVGVSDRGKVDLQFQPLDVLRWQVCAVDAGDLRQPEDLLDRFSQQLSQLVQASPSLILGVRVLITGVTPYHAELATQPRRWTEQLRAIALDVGGGNIWLEKVQFRTAPDSMVTSESLADGPLGELLNYLAELRQDTPELVALAEQLGGLKSKLPDELLHGPDGLGLDDPHKLRQWLDDVQSLLVNRLLGRRVP